MRDYFYYHRRLPHWQPTNAILFITSRLAGSFSDNLLKEIKNRRIIINSSPEPKPGHNKEIFKLVETELDQVSGSSKNSIPDWLIRDTISKIIINSILYFNNKKYTLHRFVIMPNHIHLLIEPLSEFPVWQIMRSLKIYTAREANIVLKREGRFWAVENYDHVVRNNNEYLKIVNYIDNNPVKAGLCLKPEEWKLGSAGMEYNE